MLDLVDSFLSNCQYVIKLLHDGYEPYSAGVVVCDRLAFGVCGIEARRLAVCFLNDYNTRSGVFFVCYLGFKVLCVLVPALFILGSWAAFKFVWNITPEIRAKMAEKKAAQEGLAEKAGE